MGGIGSGWGSHPVGRTTTDSFRRLDVRRLARDGLLVPGRSGSVAWSIGVEPAGQIQVTATLAGLLLEYCQRRHGEDWQQERYTVRIEETPCALGGSRPWFLCPARACGRRVAILHGGDIFACRHCHQLAYPSTRESPDDRATRRADRIRDRLGWEPGILNGAEGKPKGMRWRTFERLTAEHDRLVAVSLRGFDAVLSRLHAMGMDDL